MRRNAFSLVELTVVLLIIAMLAAAVTLRTQGPWLHAQMRDAVEAIGQFDLTTRAAAREQDRPLRLKVDLSSCRLSRTDQAGKPVGGALELPDNCRIGRVLVRRQDVTVGDIAISCSRLGLTPTYAILLKGGGRRQWMVVCGLTGELVHVPDDKQVRKLVAATGTRLHAR